MKHVHIVFTRESSLYKKDFFDVNRIVDNIEGFIGIELENRKGKKKTQIYRKEEILSITISH